MPYTTVIVFVAYDPLAAADLNSNFSNLDYLNEKVNSQIQVMGSSMIPSVSFPATYGSVETSSNNNNYGFMDHADNSGYTSAEFTIEMPADYDGGTITYHVLWTANSTSTNSVVWLMRAVAITENQAIDAAFGTAVYVTDANKSTSYYLNISDESSDVTIAGTPAAGKMVNFRLLRQSSHASDTLAATARLFSVVITYTRA